MNEVQAVHATGKTLYAVLLNRTGQVWDNVAGAWEAISAVTDATWANNTLALTEQATFDSTPTGIYLASLPAGTRPPAVAPQSIGTIIYEQAGGTPAIADAKIGQGTIDLRTDYEIAILAGKISGAGTGFETFKDLDGATNRVAVTVDSSGNRTAISFDP